MKLLSKHLEEDGPGYIKAVPEEAEDLWYAYNLVTKGDRLCAVTFRKVQKETSTGGKETERVRTKIEIAIETIEYDNVACVLRVRGKNVSENEHVKLGAYHTLEIDLQRNFVLTKDIWDSISLETLKHACDPIASADLAAVIMQEGLANVCLVGQSATIVRAKIETSIPRKRGAAIAGYDKALKKFFENVLQAILRNVDFSIVRCLIIASPGFTKDQFYEYMILEASRNELRQIIENKSKIVLAHASSGYKHSLKEVFNAPSVANLIKDTKAAKEVKVLKDFYDMLSNNPDRAIYGPKHVEAAHEQLAIQTLLLTDELFRNADIPTRKKYVNLVRSVKDSGGEVHIFSSMHVSGEQLGQLTGAAAILRFPLLELDEMEV